MNAPVMIEVPSDGAPDRAEEKLLARQRALAAGERARRARAELELARQREIEEAWRAARLCTQCGRALGTLDRFLRREKHRRCDPFVE